MISQLVQTVAPLVIAHRGASGYRPEHTLAAYALAARMGADCLEPDLVPTADGVLVARHENEVSGTTNVADHPEFSHLRTTKVVDGADVSGWFTEDFTWDQLQTLRAVERIPALRPDNVAYNGQFGIPSFQQILELRAQLSQELGRDLMLYPETKHPTYFAGIGLALEEPLMAALTGAGLNSAFAPIFIQSFEFENLRRLRTDLNCAVRLVFLADQDGAPASVGTPRRYSQWLTPPGLAELGQTVNAIGPHKSLVDSGADQGDASLVQRAHTAGLLVHPWTSRAENAFLEKQFRRGEAPGLHGDLRGEITALLVAGVDGFFSDHVDVAVAARDDWWKAKAPLLPNGRSGA